MLRWVVFAAAAILIDELFIPPVVGMADQNDFKRIIGRFGYAPEDGTAFDFLASKYVRNPAYRVRDWEQISSEYLFVEAAVLVNNLISKDGKLDIRVIGFVHALAFLAIFTRFLRVSRNVRGRSLLWIGGLLVTTDVAYAAYLNSFYAEPASYLFCLLLVTESIEICERGSASMYGLLRWSSWAVLLILAKPQNAPLGVLLGLFLLRLGRGGRIAWAGTGAVLAATVFSLATAPTEMKNANTYNLVFQAVLPESKNPAADVRALGFEPGTEYYSGTGPWSPRSVFGALTGGGTIGRRVTLSTVLRFYLSRPPRLWRHIRANLPIATLLRPRYGNFESSAGYAPGARSQAFALWSAFHESVLSRVAKFLLFLLPLPAVLALIQRIRTGSSRLGMEFFALLGMCCLTAFLTAIFGDAWDTVKHLFLFNFLLDSYLFSAAAMIIGAISAAREWRRPDR